MKLLEKILVAIDVNTDSTEQLNTTIKLPEAYTSEIILMHVVGDMELKDNIKDIVVKSVTDSLNAIKDVLIGNKVKVREPEVVFGKIVETIVQKANSERVNLTLIGSNKEKKRKKIKLGVISEQIIQESDVPVWSVNAEKKHCFPAYFARSIFQNHQNGHLPMPLKLQGNLMPN